MLEQATVNQATVNSQALHDRTSRNVSWLENDMEHVAYMSTIGWAA